MFKSSECRNWCFIYDHQNHKAKVTFWILFQWVLSIFNEDGTCHMKTWNTIYLSVFVSKISTFIYIMIIIAWSSIIKSCLKFLGFVSPIILSTFLLDFSFLFNCGKRVSQNKKKIEIKQVKVNDLKRTEYYVVRINGLWRLIWNFRKNIFCRSC